MTHRAVVGILVAVAGCDPPAPMEGPDASVDASNPNPCKMQDPAYYASCVPDGLPSLEGLWVMSGKHTNYHGGSRGQISIDLQFAPTDQPRCMEVVGAPVAPPTTTWPDPNGVWYVDSTLASLRKDIGNLAVFWDVCVDSATGALEVNARSGYHGVHTAYEWMEDFPGTLAR